MRRTDVIIQAVSDLVDEFSSGDDETRDHSIELFKRDLTNAAIPTAWRPSLLAREVLVAIRYRTRASLGSSSDPPHHVIDGVSCTTQAVPGSLGS